MWDDEDRVYCRECDERLGQITQSHLSMHGMTVAEYRRQHPDAPMQPPSVKNEVGWREDTHGDETRERISEAISAKHDRGEY